MSWWFSACTTSLWTGFRCASSARTSRPRSRGSRWRRCGTSFRRWAQDLATLANQPDRVAELPQWLDILDTPDPLVGDQDVSPRRDLVSTGKTVA